MLIFTVVISYIILVTFTTKYKHLHSNECIRETLTLIMKVCSANIRSKHCHKKLVHNKQASALIVNEREIRDK